MSALGVVVSLPAGLAAFCPVNEQGFVEVLLTNGARVPLATNTGQGLETGALVKLVRAGGAVETVTTSIGTTRVSLNPVREAAAVSIADGRQRGARGRASGVAST